MKNERRAADSSATGARIRERATRARIGELAESEARRSGVGGGLAAEDGERWKLASSTASAGRSAAAGRR
jgi:hypothetical protein